MIVAVIPAYDEATTIEAVVAGARGHADHVVVVDDGSCDGTGTVAKRAGAQVVTHDTNQGPGAATRTGLAAARDLGATVVVTLDGDGQHDPSDIPALVGPLRDGKFDIVFANRFGRPNQIPITRRVFNWCANVFTLLATGTWVSDSQCGLKAFGPRAIEELVISASGFEFCTEIVREANQRGWRIVEVPGRVRYSTRSLAKGQSFKQGVRTALATLRAARR